MSLIRLANVGKRFDNHPVLKDAYLRLGASERIGLIGRNGAGKTTLLEILLRRQEPDSGTVEYDDGLRIGYFSQFSELEGDKSVLALADEIFEDIHRIEHELAELEHAIEKAAERHAEEPSAERELAVLLKRQELLLEDMNRLDGWAYDTRIDTVLTRLGFDQRMRKRPVDELSGGWRNRAALACVVLGEPDVLLLDEPTNFLDLEGVRWLESWLRGFRGGAIVVSHDRAFLDAVATTIIEIENFHLQEYAGNYSDYVRRRQLRQQRLEREFAYEQELLAYELESIEDRRRAAKDPSRSLRRRLAGIRRQTAPRPVDRIVTDLYAGLYVPSELCRVEGIAKAYDGIGLFDDLSFDIGRDSRLAIVGPNGSGKSTLLRILAGSELPDAGTARWVKGARFVVYDELFAALEPDDTVTHAVNAMPDSLAFAAPRKKVHRFLTLLRFSDADLQRPVRTLSGGERARLALAQCLLSGASAILLDEPTNHLDITSAQVMERALAHFPGAVVVVSHDRSLIRNIADELISFQGSGSVRPTAVPAEL